MTDISTDAVTAYAEDIEANLLKVPEIKNSILYIASPTQLDDNATRFALPAVFFHYAGITKASNGRNHYLYFDVYLFAKAESLTKIKGNNVMPLATAILQRMRKEMWCNQHKGRDNWELEIEVPRYDNGDHLCYRQRWRANYKISN